MTGSDDTTRGDRADGDRLGAGAELQPDLLLSVLEQIGDGVVVSDERGRLVVFNSSSAVTARTTRRCRTANTRCSACSAPARSVNEAAAELVLSPKTVSTYRARLLEKMQLMSNSDLVRYAAQNNLIR